MRDKKDNLLFCGELKTCLSVCAFTQLATKLTKSTSNTPRFQPWPWNRRKPLLRVLALGKRWQNDKKDVALITPRWAIAELDAVECSSAGQRRQRGLLRSCPRWPKQQQRWRRSWRHRWQDGADVTKRGLQRVADSSEQRADRTGVFVLGKIPWAIVYTLWWWVLFELVECVRVCVRLLSCFWNVVGNVEVWLMTSTVATAWLSAKKHKNVRWNSFGNFFENGMFQCWFSFSLLW